MKKIVFSMLLLSLFVSNVFAQGNYGKARNLINVDNKLYHFGFILGFNAMDFNVTHAGIADDNGRVWFAEQTSFAPGFTVGIISDLRIFSFLNLRFTPALMFGDRTLTFIDQDRGNIQNVSVRTNVINFPLLLKLRGQRFSNYRPYLIGGVSTTLDLARQKENTILLKQNDFGIEFGVGCDFYLPYFKFAPEFKMFLGMNDLLERNRPEILNVEDLKYTNAISKLTSRLFVLSFNFE